MTDFVTIGSPLAHAELLLARDRPDLEMKQAERELPTCPPQLEADRFSYPATATGRTLHHAALFGPTRWSNVYFPAQWVVKGDLIGGPLQEVFGWGIRDYAVTTTLRGGFLSHTLYWTDRKKRGGASDGDPDPQESGGTAVSPSATPEPGSTSGPVRPRGCNRPFWELRTCPARRWSRR